MMLGQISRQRLILPPLRDSLGLMLDLLLEVSCCMGVTGATLS